jgi:hypothetical protein
MKKQPLTSLNTQLGPWAEYVNTYTELIKERLRHAAAMELLQAGVDRAVIALWLGHESVDTTQIYLDADLAMKERALAKTTPIKGKPGSYRPDDKLLRFLRVCEAWGTNSDYAASVSNSKLG